MENVAKLDHYRFIYIIIERSSGAPNENIVQNHLNIVLLNVF